MLSLIAETEAGVNWLLEILKMVMPALLVLLGLWIWHLKKRSEPRYESLAYLNQKHLDALSKVWSLMAYITEVENPKSVMLWEKDKNETVYYIKKRLASAYMDALSEIFYECGYGLLLERGIKELLYEYRGHLYGVLLKDKGEQENDRVKIENPELVNRIKEIYHELNSELRKELKKIER